VFILEDGTEKEFTRIIKVQGPSSSAILLYLIDNRVSQSCSASAAAISVTMQNAPYCAASVNG